MEIMKESGEDLLRLYQAGDDDAFTRLVLLYQESLAFFINGIVNDKHETECLTIEAFARLAVSKNAFQERSSLKTYLYAIGKNLALQHVKKRKHHQHLSYEEIKWILEEKEHIPESMIESEENLQQIYKAINELKDDYKEVLKLLYIEDMSYIQAAEIMSKSEKQIKNLSFRAKIALKKKLENE